MTERKILPEHLRFIIQQRIIGHSFNEIARALKTKYQVAISAPGVEYHCDKYENEIVAGMCELDKQIGRLPLSHKWHRVKELHQIYISNPNPKIRLQALAQIRAEVGEDIEKLADAIAKSGGDNVLNIAVQVTSEQLEQLIGEQAKTCGFTISQDRFKLA